MNSNYPASIFINRQSHFNWNPKHQLAFFIIFSLSDSCAYRYNSYVFVFEFIYAFTCEFAHCHPYSMLCTSYLIDCLSHILRC